MALLKESGQPPNVSPDIYHAFNAILNRLDFHQLNHTQLTNMRQILYAMFHNPSSLYRHEDHAIPVTTSNLFTYDENGSMQKVISAKILGREITLSLQPPISDTVLPTSKAQAAVQIFINMMTLRPESVTELLDNDTHLLAVMENLKMHQTAEIASTITKIDKHRQDLWQALERTRTMIRFQRSWYDPDMKVLDPTLISEGRTHGWVNRFYYGGLIITESLFLPDMDIYGYNRNDQKAPYYIKSFSGSRQKQISNAFNQLFALS